METPGTRRARDRLKFRGSGRLAQRESASFTPRRSLVRSQYRPPPHRPVPVTGPAFCVLWLADARCAGCGLAHVEGEHPVGVDARIDRPRIQKTFPLWPVARHVDVKEALAEAGLVGAADINRRGAAMNRHRKFLSRKVRSA